MDVTWALWGEGMGSEIATSIFTWFVLFILGVSNVSEVRIFFTQPMSNTIRTWSC